jgi:hypothetical protein
MPTATEEQVPKPLTYTLMYHFLWSVLFLLSALTLFGIFLSAGQGLALTVLPPLSLALLGIIAGVGAFATYAVRIQILLGNLTKEDAFRWSARSSWAVLLFAPALFATWQLLVEPLARLQWGSAWPVPVEMTIAVAKVEVVVWWISHLLSVRGLSRGRKRYRIGEAAA